VPLLNLMQRQILDQIDAGRSNQELAERLDLPLQAAKEQVSELLSLLGFFSREEMADFWAWHRSRKPRLGRLGIGSLLRPRWIGPAAALGGGLAVAVALPLIRASGSDKPIAVTSEAATPAAVASLPPSLSLRAEQMPLPASGPEGNFAYLNEAGDLMVKPMPSGQPQVVRRANGLRSPRWSSSGNYLAVVENGTLTVLDRSGKLTSVAQIQNDRTWEWSPKEDQLVVFTGDGMWLFDPTSGTKTVLRGQGAPLPESPSALFWSPDGTRVLYQLSWSVTAPGRDATSEMRIFDLRTGQDRLLVSQKTPPQGGTIPVGWSGDAEWVYYREAPFYGASVWVDGVSLMAMPSAGGVATKVGTLLGVDEFSSIGPGERVAFVDGAGRFAGESEKHVAVAAGNVRVSVATGGWDAEAAWSPDASSLVVVRMPAPAEKTAGGAPELAAYAGRKLWLETSSESRQLTSDPAFRDEHPMWSRDGRAVVFVRLDGQQRASIWRVATGGGSPTKLEDGLGLGERGAFGTYGWIDWDELMDWWQP